MAFWEEYCREGSSPCVVERSELILADRVTGSRTRLAEGPGASAPMAFSSDGRELVYGLAGELYLTRMP